MEMSSNRLHDMANSAYRKRLSIGGGRREQAISCRVLLRMNIHPIRRLIPSHIVFYRVTETTLEKTSVSRHIVNLQIRLLIIIFYLYEEF
jgi:hypothetical protein